MSEEKKKLFIAVAANIAKYTTIYVYAGVRIPALFVFGIIPYLILMVRLIDWRKEQLRRINCDESNYLYSLKKKGKL